MKIDILVATMKQNNTNFIKQMNINSNVIIANQNSGYNYDEMKSNHNFEIKMITTPYRGIGKNRNVGLFASKADICILADDDIVYVDNYYEIVQNAFKKIPQADIIIFNISRANDKNTRQNNSVKRIRWFNLLNYGAVRIAFKRENILKNDIQFSLSFGGGTYFGSGEDSLFLINANRKKMKIYTFPVIIANVNDDFSSWFEGYDEKFFYDKGKLFRIAYGWKSNMIILYYIFRYYKISQIEKTKMIYFFYQGNRITNRNKTFKEFVGNKS